MARIRSVKPTFWTDEKIGSLKILTAHHYIGLWNYVDDYGKGLDNPRLIKAAVWPLRDEVGVAEIEEMQTELAAAGRIFRWTESGGERRRLFVIPSFHEHQRPQHPTKSELPDPPSPPGVIHESFANDSRSLTNDSSHLVGEERESRSRGENTPCARARDGALTAVELSEPKSVGRVLAPNSDFLNWWTRYPVARRIDEATTRRVFGETTRTTPAADLVAGLDRWVAYWSATVTPPRYIPKPENWLRKRQWTEVPPPLRNGTERDEQLLGVVTRFIDGEVLRVEGEQ
jgi:hypothetical protein